MTQRPALALLPWALAAVAIASCNRSHGPAALPPNLRIEVEVDGSPAPPIDAARLGARPAEYSSEERRAWRLEPLLGEAYGRAGSLLTVVTQGGTETSFKPAELKASGEEPALLLNLHGEVVFTVLSATDPFPPFHGRGGNRGRPGGASIHGVSRIRLTHGAP